MPGLLEGTRRVIGLNPGNRLIIPWPCSSIGYSALKGWGASRAQDQNPPLWSGKELGRYLVVRGGLSLPVRMLLSFIVQRGISPVRHHHYRRCHYLLKDGKEKLDTGELCKIKVYWRYEIFQKRPTDYNSKKGKWYRTEGPTKIYQYHLSS